jgi:hypothetical protein
MPAAIVVFRRGSCRPSFSCSPSALVLFGGIASVPRYVPSAWSEPLPAWRSAFTGLAGIYYFLLSPFLAMMQLLIYVGAVSILIAFGIMMATPEESRASD